MLPSMLERVCFFSGFILLGIFQRKFSFWFGFLASLLLNSLVTGCGSVFILYKSSSDYPYFYLEEFLLLRNVMVLACCKAFCIAYLDFDYW